MKIEKIITIPDGDGFIRAGLIPRLIVDALYPSMKYLDLPIGPVVKITIDGEPYGQCANTSYEFTQNDKIVLALTWEQLAEYSINDFNKVGALTPRGVWDEYEDAFISQSSDC